MYDEMAPKFLFTYLITRSIIYNSLVLRMAKPCALLEGFGGMHPRENFLKRCNLVRFRVYFDQILSLFFFKNYHFLYKKINILDKLLLWGISHEEIFEDTLRLMRFGVYFETKMAIFMKK